MDVKLAASNTIEAYCGEIAVCFCDDEGRGIGHAWWMLNEVKIGGVVGRKAHRWLGYAQGILVQTELAELKTMQDINGKA